MYFIVKLNLNKKIKKALETNSTEAFMGKVMKTVSNRVALGIFNQLKLIKNNPLSCLNSAGIHYEELMTEHGRIDQFRHNKLLELSMPFLGEIPNLSEVNFGLLFSEFMPLASACGNASSLREALNIFFKYRCIIGDCDSFFQEETSNQIIFTYKNDYISEFTAECGLYNFMMLNALINHYQPNACLDKEMVVITHVSKKRLELLDSVNCAIAHGSENKFSMISDTLDLKSENHNPTIQNFFLDKLEDIVNMSLRNMKISSEMTKIIKELLWQKNITNKDNILDVACERLNMTRWTINRRLQKENTSFSLLLTKFRREESCRLLRNNDITLSQISDQLGFLNHSSFTRFFNEQFNQSPLSFRKMNAYD